MGWSPDRSIVPVLMFHSVGLNDHTWSWSHLSEPLHHFEAFLAWLSRAGFQTIGLAELQAHMRGDIRAPDNSIVLTFDDGYLDNWVYVAPLLRRAGMRGTVFVSPEFVDPTEASRPTLDDVWNGRVSAAELQPAGFMSWTELRQVDADDVLDVQSHALTHTWYFTGPSIVGWHQGVGPSHWPWLAWNARPDRKPWYLVEDQAKFVPAGHPVFEHRQALIARRFEPDPEAIHACTSFVAKHGGEHFYSLSNWKGLLKAKLQEVAPNDRFPGTYEGEEARRARVQVEIGTSRSIIGEALEKRVDYICWPAGGADEYCESVAEAAGYLGWTLTSAQQRQKRNRPGEDPRQFRRMSGQRGVYIGGRSRGEGTCRLQALQIEAHRSSVVHAALLRGYKLAAALGVAGIRSNH